jgi:hypothetical protein
MVLMLLCAIYMDAHSADHVYLSVHLQAWVTLRTTGWILKKSDVDIMPVKGILSLWVLISYNC